MGRRSGVLEREEDIEKLTLKALDAEIERCKLRARLAPTTHLRRAFEKRVHWLEELRARRSEAVTG